jgi:Tfp pilus assembly protein PilF
MQAQRTFDLGVQYLENQELEMALIAFGEAIRSDPNMAQAYNGRAVVLAIKGELQHALADASEAVRLDPWEPEFYRTRAYLYEQLGEKQSAAADQEKAEELTAQWAARAQAAS